ncbi:hypothetical protein HR45_14235 [Shewanella mangrovi]|uniref:Uncharacterized protein n=1 Tax=Shewanella mangrovi TaxID=1515746 RepID=A0A094JC22_9GAMM|nr:hypothetical protein [Shewanella mangrovi]KFZ36777.1 hypothetical protein HR45_14235 [Shewanella mangrovi]
MRYLWIAVAAAGFSLPSMASVEQAVLNCAKVDNAQQRLACFDKLSQSLTHLAGNSSASSAPTPAAPASTVVVPQAPVAPVAPRGTSATPPSVPTQVNPQQLFGAKSKIEDLTPDAIELTVASISKSLRGEMSITFKNGQVWKQLEAKHYRLRVGDKVTIKKASLGSFLLYAEGRNSSIRVQREQ